MSGWNALRSPDRKGRSVESWRDSRPQAHVYFTHSYAAPVTDATASPRPGTRETFAAVVERDNVFGVQFHPEKSSDAGLQIIRNFLEVARGLPAVARRAEAGC